MSERVPQVRPRSYQAAGVRWMGDDQAHRESGFYEPMCRHHGALGCPSTADRLGTAIAWLVIGATVVYFLAHVLAASLR